jgi:hypothetical protein
MKEKSNLVLVFVSDATEEKSKTSNLENTQRRIVQKRKYAKRL